MIEFTYVIFSHRNCLEKRFMKLFDKRNIVLIMSINNVYIPLTYDGLFCQRC